MSRWQVQPISKSIFFASRCPGKPTSERARELGVHTDTKTTATALDLINQQTMEEGADGGGSSTGTRPNLLSTETFQQKFCVSKLDSMALRSLLRR
ncbi:hypothetical protein RP20_CCG014151 [Aedes albopictus]|nr:hypothetical protein RP20_CCG014151 [Aedes albopictus]